MKVSVCVNCISGPCLMQVRIWCLILFFFVYYIVRVCIPGYMKILIQIYAILFRLHYMYIDIGTPTVSFLVALDAGSDLLWVPCECVQCAPLSASYYSSLVCNTNRDCLYHCYKRVLLVSCC